MRVWLRALLLVIVLFVVGAFAKFVLILAAIALVLWPIGFAAHRADGARWYRW